MDSETSKQIDEPTLVKDDANPSPASAGEHQSIGQQNLENESSSAPSTIVTEESAMATDATKSPQGSSSPSSNGNDAEMASPKETSSPSQTKNSPQNLKTPSPGNKLKGKDNERKRKLSPEDIENKKKAKLEREALKKEKEMKKQELKLQREKERQEKQLEKEKKEKEKEEKKKQLEMERQAKKEQLEREREEKQKVKDEQKKRKMEINQIKEEERKKKEEERKRKEEEKKKKEEEKRLIAEEEERKRERKRQAFKSFFIKNTQTGTQKEQDSSVDKALFKPFQLRPGVLLAPIHPGNEAVPNKQEFDKMFEEQTLESQLYLEQLYTHTKENGMKYMTRKQWRKKHPLKESPPTEDDCVVVNEEKSVVDCYEKETMKAKLLQFHENSRPAWYGTWTKKTKAISGRRPLGKDEDVFNYEIDSDDEWEEEDPGESLSSVEDDDKDDEVEKDNEEEDDGFFVPHGYLSDDEGIDTDEEESAQDTSMCRSPKATNDDDYSTREKVAQPVCIGCIWGTKPEDVPAVLRPLKVNIMNNFTPEIDDPEVEKIMQNFIKESRTRVEQCVMVN